MQKIILPSGFDANQITLNGVSRKSRLAWGTTRAVLQGQGAIASLDRLREALDLRWSWTPADTPVAAGAALATRRQAKGLSQRAMAAKLKVSPQTVVTLETRFRGRIDTLRRYLRVLRVMEVLAIPSKRLVPEQNDGEADLVYTPRNLAEELIAAFASEIGGIVLDPSRGDGAFYDALPPGLDKRWCEIAEGRDFFDWTEPVD